MPGESRRADSEVLPAITLDVEPTEAGLRSLTAELAGFAREHLPEPIAERMVSVARDVAGVVAGAVDAPALERLQADADVGLDDTQLVLLARDHRLPAVYPSLRARLEEVATRCDGFAAELARNAELQVWARFRLPSGDT